MFFTFPSVLYGLFLVIIPIVIHLFNFRKYKKIYFSNVKLLEQLNKVTEKKRKLKNLLILLSRILAITSLVIAFAKPIIPEKDTEKNIAARNAVTIYIDNSFSMETVYENSTLLENAKKQAKNIIEAYSTSDIFRLITCDFESKHQRFVNKDEFEIMVDDINISPNRKTFDEVLSRISHNNVKNTSTILYYISDFQKNTINELKIKSDTTLKVNLIPININNQKNITIDSLWLENHFVQNNSNINLKVSITNFSEDNLEKIPLKVFTNNIQKAITTIDIGAFENKIIDIPISIQNENLINGYVQIDDYPVFFDDKLYFAFQLYSKVKVLALNEKNENNFINTLFSEDTLIDLVNKDIKNINYTELSSYNTIFLNEISTFSTGIINEISKYVKQGGALVIIPSVNADINSYNNLSKELLISHYSKLDTNTLKISQIETSSHLYKNVFKKSNFDKNQDNGSVFKYFQFNNIPLDALELMKLSNQKPFILYQNIENGIVYQFASSLNEKSSDFVKKPIFVPTIYNIAVNTPIMYNLYATIGKSTSYSIKTIEPLISETPELIANSNNWNGIPVFESEKNNFKLILNNEIKLADNYYLSQNNKNIAALAINYDRLESNLEKYTDKDLIKLFQNYNFAGFNLYADKDDNLKENIIAKNQGYPIWKYFIILALLFLLAEILLIKLWK